MNVKELKNDIKHEDEMRDSQQDLLLTVRKSKSDDTILGNIIITQNQPSKKPLFLNISSVGDNVLSHSGFHVFKKIKKEKKRNMCDYRKNICGYITKKIIREFTGSNFASLIKTFCEEERCDYKICKSFYQAKIEHVTGPSHIPALLVAEDKSEIPMKKVFRKFFSWFLKERYVRYLLIQGKMTNKKAYIEYKNSTLLYMLKQYQLLGENLSEVKMQSIQD